MTRSGETLNRLERRTDRLRLLPWTQEYQHEWARILADPQVVRFISDGVPYTHEAAVENSERSETLWRQYGFGPWAAIDKATGRWVGRVGLNLMEDWPGPDRWEVGWELDPTYWGRGLATEGGRASVEFGFEVAGLRRIILQEQVRFHDVACVWYAVDRELGGSV